MTTQSQLKNQIRVGAFVSVALMVVLISLFMVGGDRLMKSYVTLHAHFDHVQGLNEGSVVSLQGIRIGSIQKFVFMPEADKVDVSMKIDDQYLPRITEGSRVEVRTAGALGDKFLFIIPGGIGHTPVAANSILQVMPPTDLMGMLSEKGAETGKIFDIINQVHKLTKALNDENRAETIMKNFAEVSGNMKETSQDTKALIAEMKNQNAKKLNSSIDKLNNILTKVDQGDGTLGALINDNSLHESLKAMVGGPDRKKSMKSLIRSSIEKSTEEN